MFGFGVYLYTILEQSTTRVQRVRLYSLILCWWRIHVSVKKACLALVWISTWSWNDQPHNPTRSHPTFKSNISKVFGKLHMLWMGIWIHHHSVAIAGSGFGSPQLNFFGHSWPTFDTIIQWLYHLEHWSYWWWWSRTYVNDYKEIIKNLIIKVYLERVAECDTK